MHRLRTALAALAVLAVLGAGGCSLDDDEGAQTPLIGARSSDEDAAAKLGFPATGTANTIRVSGGDPTADVAGVASAVFPATGRQSRPSAVTLVDRRDWQGAVAASPLTGTPIGAPMLLSDGGELPEVSADTLERLAPRGSDLTKDAAVIRIGSRPPAPSGLKAATIRGDGPYELAAEIDRFFSAARGRPSSDVVVTTGEDPEFAMPAAAWAARSGDAVLFAERERLPEATARALRRHERPDIFLLGPRSVIGRGVERQLARLGRVTRIGGRTPVANAIEFARFERRGFGWGVTVPGSNFTLANSNRPLDAAAAATLGANGVFAPLLLIDDPVVLPRILESYFLDVQPGYERDPQLGVFNRVWLLGDDRAISVGVQGRIDEVTELIPVQLNRP